MIEGASSRDAYSAQFVVRNRREDIKNVEQSLLGAAEEHSYESASCFAIRLAVEEALSNAFKHGNKNDPEKTVRVDCCIDPDRVVIDIEDEGTGFNPEAVPDPTEQENLEIPSGRGIVLMRAFMTEVTFHGGGSRVQMVYERPADE